MSFDENPADDRYQLDQCIDEIKSLQSQITTLTAERDEARKVAADAKAEAIIAREERDESLAALKSAPGMGEVDALEVEWNECDRATISDLDESTVERIIDLARRSISSREEVVGLLKWLDEFWDFKEVKKCLCEYASDKVYGDDQKNARRILEIVEGK